MSEPIDRLNELYFFLGVDDQKDALSAIRGLQERVRFTADFESLQFRLTRLRDAFAKDNDVICQTLGRALGFPWFKDDQANFPGATEAHGVCVGEYIAEDMAHLAADRIKQLQEAPK